MQNQATTGAGKLLDFERSAAIIAENSRYVAAGVNSNFRIGMAPGPLVFERGEGPYLFDANGNRLIDYYCGMGAMVLGHSPAGVRAAPKTPHYVIAGSAAARSVRYTPSPFKGRAPRTTGKFARGGAAPRRASRDAGRWRARRH